MRILNAFLFCLATAALAAEVRLTRFETGADGWSLRTWPDGKPSLAPLATEREALVIPLRFQATAEESQEGDSTPHPTPSRTEVVCPIRDTTPWNSASSIRLRFQLPADLPPQVMLTVFTKDGDDLWRQVRAPVPKPGADGVAEVRLPVRGPAAVNVWTCEGHQRPWNPTTARFLQEYGCVFEPDTGAALQYEGTVRLLTVSAVEAEQSRAAPVVRDLSYAPAKPAVGQLVEATFRLDAWPSAPFDSTRTRIIAEVTCPDGKTESVRGFYYEDFLYDATDPDKTTCLFPKGEPCYKVRYCPCATGAYEMSITAEIDGVAHRIPPIRFAAVPPARPFHGYVRVSPQDHQFLKYEDGTPFWGLGMNVRSPYDNRYRQVAPYSTWPDYGLGVYDRLFPKYREMGINVVEVWMCSWWLALEWIHDAPGFHGLGHYNQYRAWMLDHIFRLAAENDIHLILVINNHGKFAMHYDTEWKRNPFNKVNGGYLDRCEEYYSNERAFRDTERLLDYISARWGQFPELLSWKLFTELDLTGPNIEYYRTKDCPIGPWHNRMGNYLKSIDLRKHPVTTHWMLGFHRINDEIAMQPALDFLTTDSYTEGGPPNLALVQRLEGSKEFGLKRDKALVITEFGGSSYGDSMTMLAKQVPLGIWTGFFQKMTIIPMFWWFALVEEKQLYHHYLALSRFGKDENRQAMKSSKFEYNRLRVNLLQKDDRVLAWVLDMNYYFTATENVRPKTHSAVTLQVPPLQAGDYLLQVWDIEHAQILRETPVRAFADTPVSVTLPDFQKQLAFKLLRKE